MTVIVSGVPGVGKTTIAAKAAALEAWDITNFGSEVMRVAAEQGDATNRDHLRKLPAERLASLRNLAAVEFIHRPKLILDTQMTIAMGAEFQHAIPERLWRAEELHAIILIEAPVTDIWGRRRLDVSRQRDLDSASSIYEHQEYNRHVARRIAEERKLPLETVSNSDGEESNTIARVRQLLRSITQS